MESISYVGRVRLSIIKNQVCNHRMTTRLVDFEEILDFEGDAGRCDDRKAKIWYRTATLFLY